MTSALPPNMATSAAPPPAALDLHYVRGALRSDADVRHVLSTIESTLQAQITDLSRLIEHGDVRAAHAILHQLKGLLPVICSAAMAAQLTETAQLSRHASAAELLHSYALLRPTLHRFARELADYLRHGLNDEQQQREQPSADAPQ